MDTDTTNDFYRQFEDRFRGSRVDIKQRLSFYRPLLASLRTNVDQDTALDLGCGRGEWLEILAEIGFNAQGVDLDDGMLQACHGLGLSAKRADALETLKSHQDNSLALISALHVIEHIPFAQLLELVKEAHRALAPGGLLILETPNSENLYNTTSFYLDPTHTKPIPRALLSFVVEFGGFKTHKVVGLNEDYAQHDNGSVSLTNVIFAASPDYAVIGIKADNDSQLAAYEAFLARDYGTSLLELCKQYDRHQANAQTVDRLEKALDIINERFFAAGCKLDDTYELAQGHVQTNTQLQERLSQIESQMGQLRQALQNLSREIKKTPIGLVEQINGTKRSIYWHITRPVRVVGRVARSVKTEGIKGFGTPFAHYVCANPSRRSKTAKWLRRFGFRQTAEQLENTQAEQ